MVFLAFVNKILIILSPVIVMGLEHTSCWLITVWCSCILFWMVASGSHSWWSFWRRALLHRLPSFKSDNRVLLNFRMYFGLLKFQKFRDFHARNSPINSKLQHALPSRSKPGHLNFWKLNRSNCRSPPHPVPKQCPNTLAYCQIPLLKNNRRQLLSSLIKLVYKHANKYFVTVYKIMLFLTDLSYDND